MKYWMLTIQNEGCFTSRTVYDCTISPVHFVKVEEELGRKVSVLFAMEITEEQYKLATSVK
jgi:hypothetical protein